jgi:hypothetical protein
MIHVPLDLLPPILLGLPRPSLAAACLVSKTFYAFAIRILYERVFLRDRRKARDLAILIELNINLPYCRH